MENVRLFINGENRIVSKDSFGRKIKYQKCQEAKSKNQFLNIWSIGRYFFGAYDLWNSKEGDILSLEDDNGRVLFEFKEGRFWQMRDYRFEDVLIEAFRGMYPDAVDLEIEQKTISAQIQNYRVKYSWRQGEKGILFDEISKKETIFKPETKAPEPIVVDEPEMVDDGEFHCKRVCFFNNAGICRYFEIEMESPSGKTPDCKEPFIYIEQMQSSNVA